MKKVLFFVATAAFFASCSDNQESTSMANQATIDSMSQELLRQHLIDSMNSVNTLTGASAIESASPALQSRGSYSNERSRSDNRAPQANNPTPVGAAPVAAAPPAASNTV